MMRIVGKGVADCRALEVERVKHLILAGVYIILGVTSSDNDDICVTKKMRH